MFIKGIDTLLIINANGKLYIISGFFHMFYNEIIDVRNWSPSGEYDGLYPKGARTKSCFFSPEDVQKQYNFLKNDHYYLFKESNKNYPWQFWIEIIAYRLGKFMDIEVPPAYIGYRGDVDKYGALIEWFYNKDHGYIEGSIVMQHEISDYDIKKGEKHNFATILSFFDNKKLILEHWAKIFTFDTVIGNTDRHQDNWGIVYKKGKNGYEYIEFSPAFDNGTSMGHEILEHKFVNFDNPDRLNTYLTNSKARHHMKFNLEDHIQYNFIDFMRRFFTEYKINTDNILKYIDFSFNEFVDSISPLINVEVPDKYKLTRGRLDFILKLLKMRIQMMKDLIETL